MELENIKKMLESLKSKRGKLSPTEEEELDSVKKLLGSGREVPIDDPEKDDPKIDLTGAKLNTIFGTSGISDSDIKLSAWQGTNKFKTESEVKKLVENYVEGATEHTGLQEHLRHEEWGKDDKRGGKKMDGDWVKFIKEGPVFIIGAIKHYEWENKKGAYNTDELKNKITTEMEEMNKKDGQEEGDKKIKVKQKWDTSKASHIAQFLYKKAIGETGNKLIKEYETVDKDKKGKEEGHWGKYKWYYIGIGVPLAVIIIGAVIFWDTVSGWFGGGSAEEGTDEGEGE